eukprot:2368094-Rhodomonas_salina.1
MVRGGCRIDGVLCGAGLMLMVSPLLSAAWVMPNAVAGAHMYPLCFAASNSKFSRSTSLLLFFSLTSSCSL